MNMKSNILYYSSIPKGKEKLKLVNNHRNIAEVPLTNDMIMEDEDDIYRTKNINPNQGYKLADKEDIKKIKDVDEQIIKGISKDFNDLVNEKMIKEGGGGIRKINKEEEEEEDDIPANEFKKAEPLIPVLTFDIVKMLFSKYWRNKEEAIKILTNEIQTHPKSKSLGPHAVDKVLTAIAGASAYVLSCNVSQALIATMDMLKLMFNKFRGSNIQGYLRQDFNSYIDQSLLLMLEKVGDTNLKLKEKAENTILETANSPLVGHKVVFDHLISGQVKKTLVNSARHLSGRLSLISRMIDNFGVEYYIYFS